MKRLPQPLPVSHQLPCEALLIGRPPLEMWPSSRLSRRESSASSLKNRDGGRWPSISKKHPELCTLYCRKNCQLAVGSCIFLERSFWGERNLAAKRHQICKTERSSLDFRPETSEASKNYLYTYCMLPPGLLQPTSTISISKDMFWRLLVKPFPELYVMSQQDPYLPEHQDCLPLS